MRICAVLCVKDEGAFLLDWLAHHRACGLTDFVVCSNDCSDGTDALLDRLQALGWLTHLPNPGPYGDGGIQFTALKLADRADPVRRADWLVALDIDEFVNVHTGDRTLPALIGALPQATAITLTWRQFGNGGVVHYADSPVPSQFTRAAPRVLLWPWRAAMFKTLYRNDGSYRALGVHRPRGAVAGRLDDMHWFDAAGRALPTAFRTGRIFSPYGRDNFALAQLNHYPLGAMESYVLKAARGRAVHSDDMLGMDYWVDRNFAAEEDTSVAPLTDRAAPLRAELGADPVLANLHAAAVDWRKARFTELMLKEPFRALFGRLLMTPPSHPLPEAAAKFLLHHGIRAQEHPDGT